MAEKNSQRCKKTAKVAKATYNFVIGDDIRTLTSKNTKWYQKATSGGTILLNVIPGLGTGVSAATKGTIKGITAIVKAVKTTSSAKKAATAPNKTPKTVAAKSIKSTPKIDESKAVKASNETPKAPVTPKPERGQPNLLLKLDLQFFAKDTAKDTPNLNDGLGSYSSQGGHHPMAKSAFDGASGYDAKSALTISQSKLSEFGVKHSTITGQQHSLYKTFEKTGNPLTVDAMKQIEIKAMTNSGVPHDYATNAVEKAIQELLQSGVTKPTRIPWGK